MHVTSTIRHPEVCHMSKSCQDPMNGILLSWTIPTHLVMGILHGPMTLMRGLPLIPTLMSLVITPKRQYRLSLLWMTLHPLLPYVLLSCPTIMILGPRNMLSTMRHLTMRNSGRILVGSMWILFRKPWNSLPNGESPYPIHSL